MPDRPVQPDITGSEPVTRSRASRPIRTVLIVLLPVLAIVVAWWATRPAPPSSASTGSTVDHAAMGMSRADSPRPVTLNAASARRIGVTFAAVTEQPLGREVRTVGQVVVDETRVRTITLKVDGWIERLHVDYTGQRVALGAPLLTIYSPMLVTAQEELLLARQLMRDVAAGTGETRDGAADLMQAARRRLRWWDISEDEITRIERAGTAQRTLTLYAPAGGVVLEKNVTVGQRVMAGEPLYRVADLSSVWVDGEVYERDLAAMRIGQRATATFDALPGAPMVGRIAYVYPTLSADTRTARVRVSLPNPRAVLKPGMYATLVVASDARGRVLTVPRGALLATGERQLVFVRLPNGDLEPRMVEIGAASDDRVEILRGVTLGDTVVASATFLIDAESNLGSVMGGMGNMPGMDVTKPLALPQKVNAPPPGRPPTAKPTKPATLPDSRKEMPGMRGMSMPPTPTSASPPTTPGAHAR